MCISSTRGRRVTVRVEVSTAGRLEAASQFNMEEEHWRNSLKTLSVQNSLRSLCVLPGGMCASAILGCLYCKFLSCSYSAFNLSFMSLMIHFPPSLLSFYDDINISS